MTRLTAQLLQGHVAERQTMRFGEGLQGLNRSAEFTLRRVLPARR